MMVEATSGRQKTVCIASGVWVSWPKMKRPMAEIFLQPMTEADLDEVLPIEASSFSSPWSRRHFLDELTSPLSFPMVARMADGTVAGYICMMMVVDEGSVLNVAVHPQLRRKGIGKMMIQAALAEFHSRGASFVALEVRPTNKAAMTMYEGLGFVVTGRRKAYYENGEDAVLMEYDIKRRDEDKHAL